MRKPLYLVMGKVIQQRHIAAMVLGKFIHTGEITIFHCHDHKNGEGRGKRKSLIEREKEKLCSFVYQREMYRLSTCRLFISL
jgi:hypothetical protein